MHLGISLSVADTAAIKGIKCPKPKWHYRHFQAKLAKILICYNFTVANLSIFVKFGEQNMGHVDVMGGPKFP